MKEFRHSVNRRSVKQAKKVAFLHYLRVSVLCVPGFFGIDFLDKHRLSAQEWNDPISGSWTNETLWSTGTVPNASDAVVTIRVEDPANPYEVRLSSSLISIDSLLIDSANATLVSNNSAITVTNQINVSKGVMTLNNTSIIGGSIAGTDKIRFNSAVFDSVDVSGSLTLNTFFGELTLKNGSTISGDVKFNDRATLKLLQDLHMATGTQVVSGSIAGFLEISDSKTLTIDSGAFINAGRMVIEGMGTLVNNGIIRDLGLGSTIGLEIINSAVENHGSLLANASKSLMRVNANLKNFANGLIEASNGGSITLAGKLVNEGTIRVADAQSAIKIFGTYRSQDLGVLDNNQGGALLLAGQMDNTAGYQISSSNGPINFGGTIRNGTLSVAPNDPQRIDFTNITLQNVKVAAELFVAENGFVTFRNDTQVAGDIHINEGAWLRLEQDLTVPSGQSVFLSTTTIGSQIETSGVHSIVFEQGSGLYGNGSITSSNPVIVNGELSPGNSPGTITFQSDLNLGNSSTTVIEIADISTFDRIIVNGSLLVDGVLNVSLLNGFQLQDGMQFEFMSVSGNTTGQFAGLAQDSIVTTLGSEELRINYAAGDGNDIALYAITAVPEPTTLTLLAAIAASSRLFPKRRKFPV
jgi:hypothetical protein